MISNLKITTLILVMGAFIAVSVDAQALKVSQETQESTSNVHPENVLQAEKSKKLLKCDPMWAKCT